MLACHSMAGLTTPYCFATLLRGRYRFIPEIISLPIITILVVNTADFDRYVEDTFLSRLWPGQAFADIF